MSALFALSWLQQKAGIVPVLRRAEENPKQPINVGLCRAHAVEMFLGLPNFLGEGFFRRNCFYLRRIGRLGI
jgi:hypothetical protein